ncbi:NfeD-like protein [Prosthecochloris sp. CIB 2401]|uniref:Nodulation protein NfeD n=2 Tax=Chlorobiaceae TaxID=191412 RepID=A0A5C4RXU9_PROVB|nr:NfeD-like protein [Prosthecochloris sp. CIB 2401]TNJ36126.1 nodulation protein NfeD [Prosthecochloris vibrioformis]
MLLLLSVCISVLFMSPCRLLGQSDASGEGVWMKLEGTVNPGSAGYLASALSEAEESGAAVLLVELDTPGGLVASLREMVKGVMASRVPVVVYVSPEGARAASAGTLLTLAGHIAAMSPGTEIGAAHPVGIGIGEESDTVKDSKAVNDLAAFARSIAEARGRNVGWAERAVRESIASSADEALEAGVVDVVARDRYELLDLIDGMHVVTADGKKELKTARISLREFSPDFKQRVLMLLADPNLAYIFIMIGLAGLYFELANPGAMFPGVAGAVSLLLGLFALQMLPVNVVGLLLIVLAVLFITLEVFVASAGVLAVAGLVSMFIGSLMLFDTYHTGIAISFTVFVPVFVSLALFVALVVWLVARSALRRPESGPESLTGAVGHVVRVVPGSVHVKVYVHGEVWDARCSKPLAEGDSIIVESLQGMVLQVTPQSKE